MNDLKKIVKTSLKETKEDFPSGCIGQYGRPVAPNGPCSSCYDAEVCKRSSKK